jgi:glycosyltransferase involved in cell wall biosynthesis
MSAPGGQPEPYPDATRPRLRATSTNVGRVRVTYPSLNAPFGGGEFLVLVTVLALERLGYRICLNTSDPTDWNKIKQRASSALVEELRLNLEERYFPGNPPRTGIRVIDSVLTLAQTEIWRIWNESTSLSETADALIDIDGMVKSDISIVFSPKLWWKGQPGLHALIDRAWFGRRRAHRIRKGIPAFLSRLAMNSYGLELGVGTVVHPPAILPTESEVEESTRRKDKRLVVSVGRIVPFKRYELLIDVARSLPECQFLVVGSIMDENYLQSLLRRKPLNLEVVTDASGAEKSRILQSASIYVHLARDEPFGFALVEAMTHGCVPIVHESGGPWIEILEEGKHGIGFETSAELRDAIDVLVHDDARMNESAKVALQRSSLYTFSNFCSELARVLRDRSNRKESVARRN